MAFHCMNCGGSMVFDVSLQQMRCEHCDSTCDPAEFDVRERGIAQGLDESGMARFACQNCGAELVGTDDSMVGFCPYCGGQSMIAQAGAQGSAEAIIPFKVSKDQCSELYGSFAKGIRYLPREFRDPEYLERFTGIYMPFYEYDATFGEAHVEGSKIVESNRRYDVEEFYEVQADVDGVYRRGAPFDASRYLADDLADRAMPFDTGQELPFNAAYLAGFYADASNVAAQTYYADAAAQVEEDVVGQIAEQVMERDAIPVGAGSSVQTQVCGHHPVLYPLWFLTWRKDDRVAYAVINGESGKVVSDLPLDLRSFALGSAIISAALFVLLELLVQPTPLVTSIISVVASFLMARGIKHTSERVYEQEVHANDKGWGDGDGQEADSSANKRRGKKTQKKTTGKNVSVSAYAFIAVFVLFYAWRSVESGGLGALRMPTMVVVPLLALAYAIYVLTKVLWWHRRSKGLHQVVAAVVLLASAIVNAVIIFISPVNDGWYYLGDTACIVGLVVAAVLMMRVFNLGTTRPVPRLFDREEV